MTDEKPQHWLPQADDEGFTPGQVKKMDPTIKAEWVEKLRSGEFHQGVNNLRVKDGDGVVRHCCLGVLAEMACEAPEVSNDMRRTLNSDAEMWDFQERGLAHPDYWNSHTSMLGSRAQRWSRVNWDVCGMLAAANDQGRSFGEIADFIEAEL